PSINALTDFAHPCQRLADLMTIREYKGEFDNLKLTFVGDGNNMANSLIVGCLKVGMKVAIACPSAHKPDASVLEFAKAYGDKFFMSENVLEACKNSDVLYTDVWASMGQEGEAEDRKKEFKNYQINSEVLSVANKDAMVLHCLPAHRGEEITAEVIDAHQEIFDEAENRLHAQKAVLVKLMADK
ncbi:MAG: ornithine carbamoyltransferase, partial [Clostridia bacterium]|nr:ornithine carbamoyltransferase [Clostridia bacterium]